MCWMPALDVLAETNREPHRPRIRVPEHASIPVDRIASKPSGASTAMLLPRAESPSGPPIVLFSRIEEALISGGLFLIKGDR